MKTKIKESIKLITIAVLTATATSLFFLNYTTSTHLENTELVEPISNHWYTQLPFSPSANTDFTMAAEQSVKAVVHVKVKTYIQNNYSAHPFYEFFFGQSPYQQPQPVEGFGSGVILSEDGYIVTNNHVVNKSNEIEVVLDDKRTFTAKLIGTDPATDLALLKVEAEGLPTLAFGNSDALKIGEWVLAVGNPFNLSTTVTAGIVSAKARGIGMAASNNGQISIESFIQTDAAVNKGNSGGALVNTSGQLVGINSAIASPTGSYAGYSFAIPVSIVKKVVADLMEYGKVQRALLGVQIGDISAELAEKKGLSTLEGVFIAAVNENSAAKEAKLEEGDVITSVNNKKIKSVSELQEQISRYRPGDEIELGYIRNGKSKQVEVKLKNSFGNTAIVNNDNLAKLGASFEEISDKQKSDLKIDYGVQVVSLSNGKFLSNRIKEGYIITKINQQPIRSINDLSDVIENTKGPLFITGIYPNGKTAYFAINMDN